MADRLSTLITYFLSFHFNFQVRVSELSDFFFFFCTVGFDSEIFGFSCLSNTVLEFFHLHGFLSPFMSATQESLWHWCSWFTSCILILYSSVLHFSDPSFCSFLTSEILPLGLQELTNKVSIKFLYVFSTSFLTKVLKLLLSLSSPITTVLLSPEALSNVDVPFYIYFITSTGVVVTGSYLLVTYCSFQNILLHLP